jgi:hypothetical protein
MYIADSGKFISQLRRISEVLLRSLFLTLYLTAFRLTKRQKIAWKITWLVAHPTVKPSWCEDSVIVKQIHLFHSSALC